MTVWTECNAEGLLCGPPLGGRITLRPSVRLSVCLSYTDRSVENRTPCKVQTFRRGYPRRAALKSQGQGDWSLKVVLAKRCIDSRTRRPSVKVKVKVWKLAIAPLT